MGMGALGTQGNNAAPSDPKLIDSDTSPSKPVVVELFTSQGCSSCPPADRLAERLAQDSSLLVISRPVTYWDRLGWKDTLAREENTQLQRAYAARGFDGGGVYTPQIVVDGSDGTVGSRERMVRELVTAARGRHDETLTIAAGENGDYVATVSGTSARMANVSLVALDSAASVNVRNGENSGRTLHYRNVVLDEQTIGSWTGGAQNFRVPADMLRVNGADRYALLVQRPGAGPIVAAAMLKP
jgi:hypothetical protein